MRARRQWAGLLPALLPALLLVGCAGFDPYGDDSGLMARDPKAAYSTARIAEGAYLASGHVTPEGVARLALLDRRARNALDAWQNSPNGEHIEQARLAVSELADYLVKDAQF